MEVLKACSDNLNASAQIALNVPGCTILVSEGQDNGHWKHLKPPCYREKSLKPKRRGMKGTKRYKRIQPIMHATRNGVEHEIM